MSGESNRNRNKNECRQGDKGKNNSKVNSSNKQFIKIQSIDDDDNDDNSNNRNDCQENSNKKDNTMQNNQSDDKYVQMQQQPQQYGYTSNNDSLIKDESSLNRSQHNMMVVSDNQATGMSAFENNTNSFISEGNMSAQQQEVFQRIKYIQEQIQSLEDHDSLLLFFKAYTVHNPDIITIQEILLSEHVKLKRYKQSVYFGEIINSLRCGKGLMIYYNGRTYEGEWQNNYKFGRGFELYPNGNRYEGYFVNGKSEGMGTYVWANNEIYDGQWLGGMKHGSGMWKGQKGDSYIGEWKFGKTDGYGVHTWLNGDKYEGQFKVCLKHGDGNEMFCNGDKYLGQYVNGRPEGYGEYTWSNNSHYKGTFKNGLRHGNGIWRRNLNDIHSDRYEGEYQNDKKCGFGVFRWTSGNEFKGNYFDDLRHGYGEMIWTDGSYYKGNWERGIQSGEGELFMPNEGLKRGLFINNIFKGSSNSDGEQFINKQQQNLKQYNQQQQFFRENSKYRLSPSKSQSSNLQKIREAPNKLAKINSVSPNSMSSHINKTPIKNSVKKRIPDQLERSEGKGKGLKLNMKGGTPNIKNSRHLINSSSKNYQSFLQDENLNLTSNKTTQTLNKPNAFYSKDNYISIDETSGGKNNNSTITPQTEGKKDKERGNYLRSSKIEEIEVEGQSKKKDRQSKDLLKNNNFYNTKMTQSNKQQSNLFNHNSKSINSDDKRRSISVSGSRPYIPNQVIRNTSITPSINKNHSFISSKNNNNNKKKNNNQSQSSLLPYLNNSSINPNYNNSPEKRVYYNGKKQKQILLKKHEIILWKNLRPKLNLRKGMFKDFADPVTAQKIRTMLHPPIWKPAGISNLDYSPERDHQSIDCFTDINHSQPYLLSYYKRLKSNLQ